MMNNLALSTMINHLLTQPKETVGIITILVLGELGRWLYGKGKVREHVSDFIVCYMFFYLIHPYISELPPVHGIKLTSETIAIIIALSGARGISKVMLYVINKKTGLKSALLHKRFNKR